MRQYLFRFTIALFGGLLFLSPALLATAQETRTISFDEAVRLALEQNVTLQQVANQTEFQAIAVQRQRMNFFPSLAIGTQGRQRYGRTFSEAEGQIVNESRDFGAGLDANVNLFRGFADVANLERARYQLEAGQSTYEWQRQTTVFSVMSTYLTLIERREVIGIQEEALEAQRQQLAQIEQFTAVGTRPISDLYQQQAQVASAELSVIEAERLYQFAEAQLIQLLQLDPFGNYSFVAPDVDDLEITPGTYNPGELLRTALDRRTDIQARRFFIDAAETNVRAARSTMWPSINLGGSVGSNYSNVRALSFYDQFMESNRFGSLSLQISFPIFDRNVTRHNVQQARVELSNAELELDGRQQEVAVQVRQAYLDFQTAIKRVQVSEVQLTAANQALEAEQERYNLGAATLVELSQARALQVQAASQRVQALYDLLFQERLLDYYTGQLEPGVDIFN
jgi:outer membrane protein